MGTISGAALRLRSVTAAAYQKARRSSCAGHRFRPLWFAAFFPARTVSGILGSCARCRRSGCRFRLQSVQDLRNRSERRTRPGSSRNIGAALRRIRCECCRRISAPSEAVNRRRFRSAAAGFCPDQRSSSAGSCRPRSVRGSASVPACSASGIFARISGAALHPERSEMLTEHRCACLRDRCGRSG